MGQKLCVLVSRVVKLLLSIFYGEILDQLRDNWIISKNTQQFGAVVTLPLLICEVPVLMNDGFIRSSCFQATIEPLKLLPAHRSTFLVFFLNHFNITLQTTPLPSKLSLCLKLSNQTMYTVLFPPCGKHAPPVSSSSSPLCYLFSKNFSA